MPIPLTIIGGFLGSGKTTLINRLLADPQGIRFAVIVNDFGAINIDEQLIESHDGQTIALANGCVCCTIGDNFLRTLLQVVTTQPQPDHIVVEASGVADPARIGEIAAIDKDLSLDAVVVLADAAQLLQQYADERLTDTIERQIDSADFVLLTKTDLAAQDDVYRCQELLNARRPNLPVQSVVSTEVPAALLLEVERLEESHGQILAAHDLPFETQSESRKGVFSQSMLEDELRRTGRHILRAKGIVQTASDEWKTLQMAGERIDWSAATAPKSGLTQLVIIGPKPLPADFSLRDLLERSLYSVSR